MDPEAALAISESESFLPHPIQMLLALKESLIQTDVGIELLIGPPINTRVTSRFSDLIKSTFSV